MTAPLLLGPLLGLESDTLYTVCFLTAKDVAAAAVVWDGDTLAARLVAEIPAGRFWRAEIAMGIPADSQQISYQISVDGQGVASQTGLTRWQVLVPAAGVQPKIAYASCNGFSDYKLMSSTDHHYALWEDLLAQHQRQPFALMLLGGDQVYADSLWAEVPAIKAWNALKRKDKVQRKATKVMREQLDRFYARLYLERWNEPSVALALATIPNIMMWDDHDIFDGWGSYPADIQQCDVYQAIYTVARDYFRLFQLRTMANSTLFAADTDCPSHGFGLQFRGYSVLGMDHRSERTLRQVMAAAQWQQVIQFLTQAHGDLLVLSGVPVVYRDFSMAEKALDATPWEEELTDDLKDHWRAREHQGERARLIMHLLQSGRRRQARTVILSGDVHVGCLGVIRDKSVAGARVNVHQVVSSAIVHPAPSQIQWLGIQAVTNDNTEYLDENQHISIDMLTPHGAPRYLRTRNYATLMRGTDHKLWVNWICENQEKPEYPLQ